MRTIITAFVMKGAGVLKLNLFACCCIALPFMAELNYLLTCASNIVNLLDSLVFQLRIKIVQAGLVLCFFFFYFVFTRLENLHHFSHLCSNFQFNTIWYWWFVASLVLCWWIAESDITVMQSVTYVNWLCWWYNHTADIVSPSSALAFVTKMSEKCISTLPSAIQVKNWQNMINIEEKLDVISWLEKDEWIVDICRNVRYALSSIYRVSQEECARLREGVPYVKVYRYNPKHLCPNLNGYGDNGQRSLKLWQLLHTCWLRNTY